jgi:hypothetical protein
MTEIRFYHGSQLILAADSKISLDSFDTRSAAFVVSDYMRKDLGISALDKVKISVMKTWEGRYVVKANISDLAIIREINLGNLLK